MSRPNQYFPVDEITDLYEGGWSLRQIAERIRSNPITVGQWLRHVGVELRTRGGNVRKKRFDASLLQ